MIVTPEPAPDALGLDPRVRGVGPIVSAAAGAPGRTSAPSASA
jgi:hypothetical protein